MRKKQIPFTAWLLIVVGLLPFFTLAQVNGCQLGKEAKVASIYYSAENLRSDTFDILKYTINLEIGTTIQPQIKGHTRVRFAPKMNNRSFIRFDLLKLTIDSVKENTNTLSYTYNDTILKINFTSNKNVVDTSEIRIYYKGSPQKDASLWGGFYFDNTQGAQYAYNLGVGFAAKPHNFGRIMFPCFDNFVEKSKYEFNISCDSARRVYCNGQHLPDVLNGPMRTSKWVLNEEIPSYLASIAVAKYNQVTWTVPTLNGVKPIILAAVGGDTTLIKNGFVNLKNCIAGFENYFGPYMWNRFGYCLVPFNSGAMEHATNISYPRAFAGSVSNEDLMAHELSHHWWGNLITCETQEDMWINEGMASFSAFMFFEWQYGKANYLARVKTQHEDLLHFLHKRESGFRAISGVPHSLTYGDHVYKKGSDVAHTLRGYMGDSAFFIAAKYALQQKAYKNVNSTEFKNLMQTGGGQNLDDFFNNWVFAGGWPHFSIDSVQYMAAGSGSVNAVVFVKQKLYGATSQYTNVPLEVSFFKSDWSRLIKKVVMSGTTKSFTLGLPYTPVYAALNYDSKISDASSHDYKTIKVNGNLIYTLGKLPVQVQNKGADSSLLRVIHNYVKPDPFKSASVHKLSNQHYWKVEGILSPGFMATAQFNYNGFKGSSGTYIYLDTLLTIINADSIALFYRANASAEWVWLRSAVTTSINAKSGYITVDTLRLGEYTFGNLGDTTSVDLRKFSAGNTGVKVYPNPAGQKCSLEFAEKPKQEMQIKLYDMEGKIVLTIPAKTKVVDVDISSLARGSYTLVVWSEENTVWCSQKLIKD